MSLNLIASYIKINPRWIINLSGKPKTSQFLVENIGENIFDLGIHKDFLNTTVRAHFLKDNLVR